MKPRYIMLTIDTIAELIKDYASEAEIPADAMPISLKMKPTEPGKMAMELVSDNWPSSDMSPLVISFKIKRVYGV